MGGCEGVPAFDAAISSKCEASGATRGNSNDACVMSLEVLLSAVLVDPNPAVGQTHPDVGPYCSHGCYAHTSLLHNRQEVKTEGNIPVPTKWLEVMMIHIAIWNNGSLCLFKSSDWLGNFLYL